MILKNRQLPGKLRRVRSTAAYLLLATGLLGEASPLAAQTEYVPMHFQQIAGVRPFVEVQMNGEPFELMVHAPPKTRAPRISACLTVATSRTR